MDSHWDCEIYEADAFLSREEERKVFWKFGMFDQCPEDEIKISALSRFDSGTTSVFNFLIPSFYKI